jgi:hypothetical protein
VRSSTEWQNQLGERSEGEVTRWRPARKRAEAARGAWFRAKKS